MPVYEFLTPSGNRACLRAPFAAASAVMERARSLGWKRVWSVPHVIVQPSFAEAMEKWKEEDRAEQTRWEKRHRERMKEVISSLRAEDREALASGEVEVAL